MPDAVLLDPEALEMIADLDRRMLNQSLKNIEGLLDGEENPDIVSFLKVAKQALEWVMERKWPLAQEPDTIVHERAMCTQKVN